MELVASVPVSLTAGAISAIKKLREEPSFNPEKHLRIGV
jgi:hypothetical protein